MEVTDEGHRIKVYVPLKGTIWVVKPREGHSGHVAPPGFMLRDQADWDAMQRAWAILLDERKKWKGEA
jgi:hypothetical protein